MGARVLNWLGWGAMVWASTVELPRIGAQACGPVGPTSTTWWDGSPGATTGTLADLHGHWPLNLLGDATVGPGYVGDGIYFDGMGDWGSTTSAVLTASSGGSLSEFTVEAWIRVDSSGVQTILAEENASGVGISFGLDASNRLRGTIRSNCTQEFVSSLTVPVGVWTHVAMLGYALLPDLAFAVNGSFDFFPTSSSGTCSGTGLNATYVGRSATGTEYFHGVIDELTLYDSTVFISRIVAVVAGGTAGKCRSAAIPSDLRGWWRAGTSGQGGQILDHLGVNDAVPFGSPSMVPGRTGPAVHLDGQSGYEMEGRSSLATTGPFTVEAWVRPELMDGEARGIVSDLGTTGTIEGQFAMFLRNGNVFFERRTGLGNGVERVSVSGSFVDRWQHLCGVYDGTNLSIYVNGLLHGAGATPEVLTVTNPPRTTIGGGVSFISGFRGNIEEVAFYERALSATEIRDIAIALEKDDGGITPPGLAGTGDDFDLVLRSATGFSGATNRRVLAGDAVTIDMLSPGVTLTGSPLALVAQLYAPQSAPIGVPGLPGVHVDPLGAVILFGVPGLLGPPLLSPAGSTLELALPPGALIGQVVRLQAFTTHPMSQNQLFAASPARNLHVR